jgi:outer membrane protein assembly factor BamB
MLRRGAVVFGSLLAVVSPTLAGDWPQFRGPGGSGVSSEVGLPTRWSATEGLRWKVELPGRGLSNPVITGGRVYVTACSGYQQTRLHVLCLDQATGKRLWERQVWATGNTHCNGTTNMAAPTPVTDGQNVFALFATGDLIAFDRDGNLLWYRALAQDYPKITNQVGMASSPVLWNDVLLLAMENDGDSFVAGLDKHTGVNRWKVTRDRQINWATPVVRIDGERPEALFMTAGELLALDPETGKRRWSYRGEGLSSTSSIVLAEGLVILPGGVAIRPPGKEGTEPAVIWKSSKLRTGLSSFLHDRGRVYAVNPSGVLNCADVKDGRILWSVRTKGTCSATPVAADGKVYLVNEEGLTSVVQTADEGRLLTTNPVGETIQATPAIADGAIFLRSDRHLYCVGERR